MYGIFEMTPTSKRRAFEGKTFDEIEDVEAHVADIAVSFERDDKNDAADFFTKLGQVFAVERITA